MIYTIKKGCHKSTIWPSFTFKKSLSGSFRFKSGCEYVIDKQKDMNKLIGLSDNWHHHMDSLRIGWRYDLKKKTVELSYIVYKDNARHIGYLQHITINKEYNFKVEILEDKYVIQINGNTTYIERSSKWCGPRYKLNPYFGGTTKSPNEIIIDISLKNK